MINLFFWASVFVTLALAYVGRQKPAIIMGWLLVGSLGLSSALWWTAQPEFARDIANHIMDATMGLIAVLLLTRSNAPWLRGVVIGLALEMIAHGANIVGVFPTRWLYEACLNTLLMGIMASVSWPGARDAVAALPRLGRLYDPPHMRPRAARKV